MKHVFILYLGSYDSGLLFYQELSEHWVFSGQSHVIYEKCKMSQVCSIFGDIYF